MVINRRDFITSDCALPSLVHLSSLELETASWASVRRADLKRAYRLAFFNLKWKTKTKASCWIKIKHIPSHILSEPAGRYFYFATCLVLYVLCFRIYLKPVRVWHYYLWSSSRCSFWFSGSSFIVEFKNFSLLIYQVFLGKKAQRLQIFLNFDLIRYIYLWRIWGDFFFFFFQILSSNTLRIEEWSSLAFSHKAALC